MVFHLYALKYILQVSTFGNCDLIQFQWSDGGGAMRTERGKISKVRKIWFFTDKLFSTEISAYCWNPSCFILSQSSWPKIVVRKWLNLQSRGDEFYSDSFSLKGNNFCSVSGAFRVSVSDFKNVLGNFSADKTERRKSCSDKDCYVVVPDKFSGDFYCVVAL